MSNAEKLGEAIKRYGYNKKKRIKLYGEKMELVSDPVNPGDDKVYVEARAEGTEEVREVQVPRNLVQMTKGCGRK